MGVTNDLDRRTEEHKSGLIEGFTKKCQCKKLIYYEEYNQINAAMAREKQIKGWRRSKKEALIKRMNPGWRDLILD